MNFSITTANTSQFLLGILMLVGAVVIPAAGVLIWILFFRKNSRRRRRRRESHHMPTVRHGQDLTDKPTS